jgi:hypothetical protein
MLLLDDWGDVMVSIVEAAKNLIIMRLEEAKLRILEGTDSKDELDLAEELVEKVMDELDFEVRLVINSYW